MPPTSQLNIPVNSNSAFSYFEKFATLLNMSRADNVVLIPLQTTRDPTFLFSPSSETSSNMETLISVVTRKLMQSTQCSQKLVPSFAVVQERAIFPRTSQWGGRYHPLHLRKCAPEKMPNVHSPVMKTKRKKTKEISYRNQRVPLANSWIIKYVRINQQQSTGISLSKHGSYGANLSYKATLQGLVCRFTLDIFYDKNI